MHSGINIYRVLLQKSTSTTVAHWHWEKAARVKIYHALFWYFDGK